MTEVPFEHVSPFQSNDRVLETYRYVGSAFPSARERSSPPTVALADRMYGHGRIEARWPVLISRDSVGARRTLFRRIPSGTRDGSSQFSRTHCHLVHRVFGRCARVEKRKKKKEKKNDFFGPRKISRDTTFVVNASRQTSGPRRMLTVRRFVPNCYSSKLTRIFCRPLFIIYTFQQHTNVRLLQYYRVRSTPSRKSHVYSRGIFVFRNYSNTRVFKQREISPPVRYPSETLSTRVVHARSLTTRIAVKSAVS